MNIQIRNPLNITGFTQPLIIIDDVIPMQDDPTIGTRAINGNPFDLEGANIESIEAVRGAAAATLYGQRAAKGVIDITAKKGTDLARGSTRMTLNNEGGFSQVGKRLPIATHHYFLTDESNQFVDSAGRPITEIQSANFVEDPNRIVDDEWGVRASPRTSVSVVFHSQLHSSEEHSDARCILHHSIFDRSVISMYNLDSGHNHGSGDWQYRLRQIPDKCEKLTSASQAVAPVPPDSDTSWDFRCYSKAPMQLC